MARRSGSFIKNKWVGAASQIARRTTSSDVPMDSLAGRWNGGGGGDDTRRRNVAPREWREFTPEMIDLLRQIQGRTTDGRRPNIFQYRIESSRGSFT